MIDESSIHWENPRRGFGARSRGADHIWPYMGIIYDHMTTYGYNTYESTQRLWSKVGGGSEG